MSFYRQQLEDYLKQLDVKADQVLDIGGKQNPVENRTKSWEVKDYTVLDLPDFDIEEDAADYEADVVFCLEVFEYLIRPLEALYNIEDSLKVGGTAYVTFQFIYPRHNELEFDSLRYTETGIRRMAEEVDLTIKNITYRYDRSGILTKFYSADGMRAAKGLDHNITGYIVEFVK